MDPDETVEVDVSKVSEVTSLSDAKEQSGSDNYEIRFSSEQASQAVRGRQESAWEHVTNLLSTVQMFHESL